MGLLLSSSEYGVSCSLGNFKRRLIGLIFDCRNRIIIIRRELPPTVNASLAEPAAWGKGGFSLVLGRNLTFEQVTPSVFLETLGIPEAATLRKHFEAVLLDQLDGLIAGTDTIGQQIIGAPLMTVEAFVNASRSAFEIQPA